MRSEKLGESNNQPDQEELILGGEEGGGDELKEEEVGEDSAEINSLIEEIQSIEERLLKISKGSEQRKLKAILGVRRSTLRRLETGFPGRRIPRMIVHAVMERDKGKDFGRPNHICKNPGRPHHIAHFSTLKNEDIKTNPHTIENLQAPCQDCHKLAHTLDIPSGTRIEDYFRSFSEDDWKTIELLLSQRRISDLKDFVRVVKS